MTHPEEFAERVVVVPAASRHLRLLVAADGRFLTDAADRGLDLSDVANDAAMWEREPNGICHAVTGTSLGLVASGAACTLEGLDLGERIERAGTVTPATLFVETQGPERMPSAYLSDMRANGWVCLTSILSPALVDRLERDAGTGRYETDKAASRGQRLVDHGALAKTLAEPVSLWVVRQYMGTKQIRVAHPPALAVLPPDDGKRNVQGWHTDYPYHWGIPGEGIVPTASGATVLGVQRNVCVSPFTKESGATAFKLGSHALDCPPPEDWGTVSATRQRGYRQSHGLPYNGRQADVVEAPAGSIILYDARTWHRAGVNRTDRRRAALLQAMIPSYVMPKSDTSKAFRLLQASSAWRELSAREQAEVQSLMVCHFPGPNGQYAISPDAELTDLTRAGTAARGY